MQYRVGVIGRFGFGRTLLNGQTIKTKTVVSVLTEALGEEEILLIDTYGGIKALLRMPFACFYAECHCKNVIILPARKGIRIIAPLLALYNKIYHRKLHYVVIGGWLNELLKDKWVLIRCLKCFDWIYAETSTMKKKLEESGFQNVVFMPNFKELPVLMESEVTDSSVEVCRLVTFSRVMKEKGIATAAEAVTAVNTLLGKEVYRLDIYGPVDPRQQNWFDDLKCSFPKYIRYCGDVPYDKSVSVLKNYDALLFPTHFYTEGIPGTIIDAYAAGIPVIASYWENFSDIVDEQTGIGYPFEDPKGLQAVLLSLKGDPTSLWEKKTACLKKAQAFLPEAVVPALLSRLD